jgi:hypothetical protein
LIAGFTTERRPGSSSKQKYPSACPVASFTMKHASLCSSTIHGGGKRRVITEGSNSAKPPVELGADTDPFLLRLFAALAERERRNIGERTRLALAAAKARGVKLGGTNRQSIENRDAALARAETLRPVLNELAGCRTTPPRRRAEQAQGRDASWWPLARSNGQPSPRPAAKHFALIANACERRSKVDLK